MYFKERGIFFTEERCPVNSYNFKATSIFADLIEPFQVPKFISLLFIFVSFMFNTLKIGN